MSGADLLEDGFPHGTVGGYIAGCKSSACPVDHGITCRRAKELAAGDYRYGRLIARGLTPAQIAAELGEGPHVYPDPAPRRATVPDEDEDDQEPLGEEIEGEDPIVENTAVEVAAPSPATIVKGRKPEPQQVPDWPEEPIEEAPAEVGESSDTSSQAPVDPSPAAIRAWARENGVPVNARGKVQSSVVEAYMLAHGHITVEVPADDLTMEEEDAIEWAMAAAQVDDAEQLVDPAPEDVDVAAVAEEVITAIVHGPVIPDMETRAELFNEGWDEARKQSVESTIELLSSSLDFTLSMWAMEADRARSAEHRAARAERELAVERARPWWKRRAS